MELKTRTLLTGASSYLPGVLWMYGRFFFRPNPNPPSAKRCYTIWLKHLLLAKAHGLSKVPETVAEIGPGGSLGVGLAALICGVDRYYGLDKFSFADLGGTLTLFDQIVDCFRTRVRPDYDTGYPPMDTCCGGENATEFIFGEKYLEEMLAESRLEELRRDIELFVKKPDGADQSRIRYVAPWQGKSLDCAGSVDFLMSHVVLEYAPIDEIWCNIRNLMKPGGITTHYVEFQSHCSTRSWNGHWACSSFLWNIALGRKAFLVNREPHSRYLSVMHDNKFTVTADLTWEDKNGISRKQLAKEWRNLSDSDLVTRGAFFVARRNAFDEKKTSVS